MRTAFKRRELKRKAGTLYSKRAGKARTTATGTIVRFPRYMGDQPHRKYCKLQYISIFNTAGIAANTLVQYEYRANGMFKPDAAGARQPIGHSRMMDQYHHFTVIRSTITVEHLNANDASNQIWQIFGYNDTNTPALAFAIAPGTNYNQVNSLPIISQSLAATAWEHKGGRRMVSLSYDMSKHSGKPAKDLIGEKEWTGDSAADPAEQSFFGVCGTVPGGTVSAVNCQLKVRIIYYAVYTEPRMLAF